MKKLRARFWFILMVINYNLRTSIGLPGFLFGIGVFRADGKLGGIFGDISE